jgi:hypothetical protein
MLTEVFVPPNQVKLTITTGQYQKILIFIKASKETLNLIVNGNSGNASIDGVEFAWNFDGIDELRLFITKVHSVKAHLAGNSKIFRVLIDELNKIV